MKRNTTYKKGQSMIEAIVAVGIVLLLVTGLIAATTSSLRFGQQSTSRSQAVTYAREGLEIVRSIRDNSWNSLPNTGVTSYCLAKGQTALGVEAASCAINIDSIFSRKVTIDSSDPDKKSITVVVTWPEGAQTRSLELTTILTDWRTAL